MQIIHSGILVDENESKDLRFNNLIFNMVMYDKDSIRKLCSLVAHFFQTGGVQVYTWGILYIQKGAYCCVGQ